MSGRPAFFRSGLKCLRLRLLWLMGVPVLEGKTKPWSSQSPLYFILSSSWRLRCVLIAATTSGRRKTARPLPVFVVSRMRGPLRVAERLRRMVASPEVPLRGASGRST